MDRLYSSIREFGFKIPVLARSDGEDYPQSTCRPHRLRFSDGHSYVVKFQGNPCGNQALVNELVAAGIAQLAGFSVPHGSIVTVDADFINSSDQLTGFRPSLQFGSRIIDRACQYESAWLSHISNHEELAQIIVLDIPILYSCARRAKG